jgi:prepilin-type N-terminal cleavage/methylation domain-containing protein
MVNTRLFYPVRKPFGDRAAIHNFNRVRGVTLVELLMVAAVIGILFSVFPHLFIQSTRNFQGLFGRGQVQRDAREALDVVINRLSEAKASSINLTSPGSQPPYSRLVFSTVNNVWMEFYQNGHELVMIQNGKSRIVMKNLRRFSVVANNASKLDKLVVHVVAEIIVMRHPVTIKLDQPVLLMNP